MALPAIASLLSGALGGGGGGAASALGGLGKAIGGLQQASEAAAGMIKVLGDSLISGLTGPLTAIQGLAGSIGQFVEKIDPGVMQQFSRVMDNAMATVGSILLPIMQSLTVVTSAFADGLAALAPVIQPLFDQISGVISGFATAIMPLMEALAPIINVVVQGMNRLIDIWVQWEGMVVGFVTELLSQLTKLLGLQSAFDPDAKQKQSIRNVGVSDVQGFASSQFANSVKLAFGDRNNDDKREAAETQKKVAAALAEGKQAAADLANAIKLLLRWLERFENAKEAAKSSAGGLGVGLGGRAKKALGDPDTFLTVM